MIDCTLKYCLMALFFREQFGWHDMMQGNICFDGC